MDIRTIFILTNSPGEISGWLRPLVKTIKKVLPECRISVILLPCVFASGRERKVIEGIQEVDEVIPSGRFLPLLLERDRGAHSELIHLGGDIMFTAFLARMWKMSAWCYQWGKLSIDRFYRGYFVKTVKDRERLEKLGISANKITIVGDLLIDSVRDRLGEDFGQIDTGEVRTIAFMAGSRLKEVVSMLPFYLQLACLLKKNNPERTFKALISPYIDRKELENLGELEPVEKLGGLKGTVDSETMTLRADGVEVSLVYHDHIRELRDSQFVITIPGTKTGEAGCLAKPMAVLLPLNKPEDIPYIGLVGLLDWLPVVGPMLKAPLIMKISRSVGFVAQPNILAGRKIVPEIVGVLEAEKVAAEIEKVLQDNHEITRMREELKALYEPFSGAASRMISTFGRTVKPELLPDEPFFSIVICTKNRKELLEGTIKTLDDQTVHPGAYEIVVVDDGSDDGTDEMMAGVTTRCRLRYFKRPWQGRAATRNFGIREATGDIIVFVDDDILAPRDFLFQHSRYHRQFPRAITRGPIINIERYRFPEDTRAGIADFSQAFFCTCNVSVPRKELLDIGGFDESFVEYGYEDNEVGWRLRQRGLKAHFNMKAIVYHFKPPREELDGMIQTACELARSAVAYYRKHPYWKVRLAAGLYPLYFIRQALFANRYIKDFYMDRWKKVKAGGNTALMKKYERVIFDYYYTETLRKEWKKKG